MPSWTAYYLRRYIRILVPMGVAILLALPLKLRLGIFSDSILWSLLCEEIYYFIYPGLLRLRDRLGWRTLLVLAFFVSLLTILTNPGAREYPSYGPWLNWALGLPCWANMGVAYQRLGSECCRLDSQLPHSHWPSLDAQSLCCLCRFLVATGNSVLPQRNSDSLSGKTGRHQLFPILDTHARCSPDQATRRISIIASHSFLVAHRRTHGTIYGLLLLVRGASFPSVCPAVFAAI